VQLNATPLQLFATGAQLFAIVGLALVFLRLEDQSRCGMVLIVMSKTATLSVKLTLAERKDLNDLSHFRGTPPTALGAQFIAEGLRVARFPGIEFRNTPLGRMAYLKNSRLAVWLLRELVRQTGSVKKVAKLIGRSAVQLEGALLYARAFPTELDAAARLNKRAATALDEILPGHTVFRA